MGYKGYIVYFIYAIYPANHPRLSRSLALVDMLYTESEGEIFKEIWQLTAPTIREFVTGTDLNPPFSVWNSNGRLTQGNCSL